MWQNISDSELENLDLIKKKKCKKNCSIRKKDRSIKRNHNSSSTRTFKSLFPKHVQKSLRSVAVKIGAVILTFLFFIILLLETHRAPFSVINTESFGFSLFLFIIIKLLPSEEAGFSFAWARD